MDSNVARTVMPAEEPELLAQAQPFEPYRLPDPPSVDGMCGRCEYSGTVYPGRYGGHHGVICFGV